MSKNYKLLKYSVEDLLARTPSSTLLVYEDDVQPNGSAVAEPTHVTLTEADACAIMNSIVSDNTLMDGLRSELERAKLNPDGNNPSSPNFRLDPNIKNIQAKIIDKSGATTPNISSFFSLRAYEYLSQ